MGLFEHNLLAEVSLMGLYAKDGSYRVTIVEDGGLPVTINDNEAGRVGVYARDGSLRVTIVASEVELGGGGPPAGTPHSYWRVVINDNHGDPAVALGEVEFLAGPGDVDQAVGGTVSASGSIGPFVPGNAFDDDPSTLWAATGPTGNWIAYEFTSPVSVGAVALRSRSGGFENQAPSVIAVQWSDDGATWNTAWTNTGIPSWSSSTRREFTPGEN